MEFGRRTLVIGKIIWESAMGHRDVYYIENILTMFVITVVATFILSLHKYLQNVPILLVMLLQYAILIGVVMGGIWIGTKFMHMSQNAYKDMFWSEAIPYRVLAGIYYISFFMEVKNANKMLMELNQNEIIKGICLCGLNALGIYLISRKIRLYIKRYV